MGSEHSFYEKRSRRRKKKQEKKGEKTDENSGHYVIASSRPPKRRPLERRTLAPIAIEMQTAQLGVPHSRIKVELGFILQAGICQILNFAQNPRQSQSV